MGNFVFGILTTYSGHHESAKSATRLATGLNQIADILPRAELNLQLYPTPQTKQVIVDIYAQILKFLLRALRWYQESKLKHVIHSITRPIELRYDDLMAKISSLSLRMTDSASASSHAEQRDMHTAIQYQSQDHQAIQQSIDQLTSLVLQMRDSMATEQVINASARIELRQQISQIQLVQFLDQLSVTTLVDPIKAFQRALFLQVRNQHKPGRRAPAFWLDTKVQEWNKSRISSLVIIKGTWKLQYSILGFCTESIASLRETQTPVIWALKTPGTQESGLAGQVSTIDLIKYLISQSVSVNKAMHTDAALTPHLGCYLSAKTDDEWLSLLTSVLQGIPLLYIILDMEVPSPSLASLNKNFWPSAFLNVFSQLSARNIITVIKVALVDYGSLFQGPLISEAQERVSSVGALRKPRASNGTAYRRGGARGRGRTLNLRRAT